MGASGEDFVVNRPALVSRRIGNALSVPRNRQGETVAEPERDTRNALDQCALLLHLPHGGALAVPIAGKGRPQRTGHAEKSAEEPPKQRLPRSLPCLYALPTVRAIQSCKAFSMDPRSLDDLARRLAAAVPEGLTAVRRDLESNFKAVLQSGLSKLDLVTRQEFDVQAGVLRRTREKLEALEARLAAMEKTER